MTDEVTDAITQPSPLKEHHTTHGNPKRTYIKKQLLNTSECKNNGDVLQKLDDVPTQQKASAIKQIIKTPVHLDIN